MENFLVVALVIFMFLFAIVFWALLVSAISFGLVVLVAMFGVKLPFIAALAIVLILSMIFKS